MPNVIADPVRNAPFIVKAAVAIAMIVVTDLALTAHFEANALVRLAGDGVLDAAVSYGYQSKYTSLKELQVDYPSFKPIVAKWSDYGSGLLHMTGLGWGPGLGWGLGLFSITLPNQAVIVDATGRIVTGRPCTLSHSLQCVPVPPTEREYGVVGHVVLRKNGVSVPVSPLAVNWTDARRDGISISGNCFTAFSKGVDAAEVEVRVSPSHMEVLPRGDDYGFFDATVVLHSDPAISSSTEASVYPFSRITRAEFRRRAECPVPPQVVSRTKAGDTSDESPLSGAQTPVIPRHQRR